jgi:hypothetical protein
LALSDTVPNEVIAHWRVAHRLLRGVFVELVGFLDGFLGGLRLHGVLPMSELRDRLNHGSERDQRAIARTEAHLTDGGILCRCGFGSHLVQGGTWSTMSPEISTPHLRRSAQERSGYENWSVPWRQLSWSVMTRPLDRFQPERSVRHCNDCRKWRAVRHCHGRSDGL